MFLKREQRLRSTQVSPVHKGAKIENFHIAQNDMYDTPFDAQFDADSENDRFLSFG
jgi:hypothetical protein